MLYPFIWTVSLRVFRHGTRSNRLLHTNFNQTVTATGRLSSSNPNFQNQPKRGFPIRKCVVSRFEDGFITEADFSGLEFRVAGALSNDAQIMEDIKNGKDIHNQTASIINRIPPSEVTKRTYVLRPKIYFRTPLRWHGYG